MNGRELDLYFAWQDSGLSAEEFGRSHEVEPAVLEKFRGDSPLPAFVELQVVEPEAEKQRHPVLIRVKGLEIQVQGKPELSLLRKLAQL